MSVNRSRSRELVLQIVFWVTFENKELQDYEKYIEEFENEFKENEYGIDLRFLDKEYCLDVLDGISSNKSEIDTLIEKNLKKWRIDRLPKVDLSILRLATYEMCFKSLDPRIAINEAINLTKKYCGDKSPSYINGVLNSIKEMKSEG